MYFKPVLFKHRLHINFNILFTLGKVIDTVPKKWKVRVSFEVTPPG